VYHPALLPPGQPDRRRGQQGINRQGPPSYCIDVQDT